MLYRVYRFFEDISFKSTNFCPAAVQSVSVTSKFDIANPSNSHVCKHMKV